MTDTKEATDHVLGLAGYAFAPACIGFGALQYFHYEVSAAGVALVVLGVAFALTRALSRHGVRPDRYLGGVFFVAVTLTSYLRGGAILPVLSWGVTLPVGAAILNRTRGAATWAVLLLVQLVGLSLIEWLGWAPPRVEASTGAVLGSLAGTAMVLTAAVVTLNHLHRRNLAQVEEAGRRLYEANKLEGIARLAGGVAHDFNNLLAVIAGRTRAMARVVDRDHEIQLDLRAIEEATERGAELTRRLLAIGREDGSSEPVAFDINELIQSIATLLGAALPDNIVLEHELTNEALVVEGDPKRMHQLVMNLALNGRDAMHDGGRLCMQTKRVWLDAPLATHHGELASGNYVVMSVEDDGEGMAEDIVDKIFEPFFTTKERGIGSGLGLAVVDGIVTAMGGAVDVRSHVGHGTTIIVYLPASDAVPEPLVVRSSRDVVPERRYAILLVEDDDAVRAATSRVLKLDGHEVLVADGGASAIRISEEHPKDIEVLLTDVVMPHMSGYELALEIRRQRPTIGVIFCTGYGGDDIDQRRVNMTGGMLLQKPVAPEALARALAAVTRAREHDGPESGTMRKRVESGELRIGETEEVRIGEIDDVRAALRAREDRRVLARPSTTPRRARRP